MKHKAMATITIPVEAVFEDDGEHPLIDQAEAALEAEAEWKYCLTPGEFKLDGLKAQPLGRG